MKNAVNSLRNAGGFSMRRIVTVDGPAGSEVLIDLPPSANFGGLFEAWREVLTGQLDPCDRADLGPGAVRLVPPGNGFTARWFTVEPRQADAADDGTTTAIARGFGKLGAADCHLPRSVDPAMHRTKSTDIVCLLSGSASLILENGEVLLTPGCVVLQRGTAHAWRAHGGDALFFAVLIDRAIAIDYRV
jgi:hypothetical protein